MAYLGLALVIANDYRDIDRDPNARIRRKHLPGTHEDSKDYLETFGRYLKYKVILGHNLSGNGIRSAVDNLISETRHCPFGREEACVAFVFCGHGEEGVIVGQDGAKVHLREIFKRFTSGSDLVPLVKLFFIDACRGEYEDRGVWTARGGEVLLENLVPSKGNMLITYSTLPQFRAYELANKPRGLFSGILNQELRNDANLDETWDNIIVIVTKRMEEESKKLGDQVRFQTPERVATLRRIVKPLKEAKEFQPLHPVPAPRRRVAASNQRSMPPQQSSAGEPSPSLWAAGGTAGSGQVLLHQTAAGGSTQPSLQPQSMAHQSLVSGPAPQSKLFQHILFMYVQLLFIFKYMCDSITCGLFLVKFMRMFQPCATWSLCFLISAAHWTTPPAAMLTPGVAGGTPCILVDGPTPTPYVSGATPPSYVSGATPPSYVSGATPPLNVSGATPPSYVSGATPPLNVSAAMPTPPRAPSLPTLSHNLSHLTARDVVQDIAREAGRCPKKNFTVETSTMSGEQYCCEVEFLHSSGRLCKGKSGFHASKDIAEESACRNLLRNSEFLTSAFTANAPGNQQRIQPSLEPNASSTGEGSRIAPPLGTDAAQQTVSVTARSVAHPPLYYQEHPQSGAVYSRDESQSNSISNVTNYQGQPQVGGTSSPNYRAHSQVGTSPHPNYQGQPQVGTVPTASYQGQLQVGIVTSTNYQGYPPRASTDHNELPSTAMYHDGPPQSSSSEGKTPKTQLKEYCDQRRWPHPQYTTEHLGRAFRSTVLVRRLGAVTGSQQASKKKAELDAAAKAISQLALSE